MSRGSNRTKVEQWSDRLVRFANSDLTVTAFCVAEGVSQPSFYQWKKKLGGGGRVRGGRSKRGEQSNRAARSDLGIKSSSAFQAVQVTPTPGLQQRTTIRLADGVEIELGDNLRVVEMVVRSVVERVLPSAAVGSGASPC